MEGRGGEEEGKVRSGLTPPPQPRDSYFSVAKPAARVGFQRKSPIVGSLSQSGAGDILE